MHPQTGPSKLILGTRPERRRRSMEFRIIPRPSPAHSREFRTVRMDGQSVQLRPSVATPAAKSPQEPASPNLRIQNPPADDHTAARALKAKRRLRRLFERANRNAKGRARADEYEILRCAYRAVRAWRSDVVHHQRLGSGRGRSVAGPDARSVFPPPSTWKFLGVRR